MTISALTRLVPISAALLVLTLQAIAQPYPNRTVRIVVAHAAGSSPDVVARLVANRLGQRLNQTFIIENKVGANGSLAAEAASRAIPDGYTLLLAGSSVIATNPFLYPKSSGVMLTGLTPLTNLTTLDFLLAVRSSLNLKNFSDLLAHIKTNPGKLNLATTNIGSFQYLGAALLKQQGGLDFTVVPYNGGAAAVAAVAGGHVDMLIDAGALINPLAQGGAMKIVATTGAARDPAMPDVPTIAESGFPGYRVLGWIGMMAPAGTPADVLTLLHANIAAVFKEDDLKAQLKTMGLTPVANAPNDFAQELEQERETWKRLIAKLGIILD
jgi:tripartite-type tricarboxylate transporter receptor subunit TctC